MELRLTCQSLRLHIASPSEAATSAVASEAVGAEQTLPVDTQNAVSSGDSSAPQPEVASRMMPRCSQMPATRTTEQLATITHCVCVCKV